MPIIRLESSLHPLPSLRTIFWEGTLLIGMAYCAVGIFPQAYTGSSNCVIGNSMEPRELTNLNGMDAQTCHHSGTEEASPRKFSPFSLPFSLFEVRDLRCAVWRGRASAARQAKGTPRHGKPWRSGRCRLSRMRAA